ncbi:unnamed protein product [Albugo candida]|uniref:Uncharacterized protein n=1 Tax=Albugo candida TaxID=65357 RepID=A0A024G320_9STRA|nr:unnamed protein product [Albugo candida]|eukprot:CCI40714.1 unnamed protein product [Albugo candida]
MVDHFSFLWRQTMAVSFSSSDSDQLRRILSVLTLFPLSDLINFDLSKLIIPILMWHNLVNEMSAWNSSYCEAKRMQIGESCTSQIVIRISPSSVCRKSIWKLVGSIPISGLHGASPSRTYFHVRYNAAEVHH